MKVAAVYTSTTPELIEKVNVELAAQFNGEDFTILSFQNAGILQEARENGHVTPHCTRSLIDLYEQAVQAGADIILNVCSSVGDVAKLAKPLYEMAGTAFVRIDEDMARAAIRAGRRIGVVATLPTTLEPTKRLLQSCADEAGIEIELVDALAEGAFGLNQDEFKERLIQTGTAVKDKVDLLLFAQGSMAYAEQAVSDALGLPVFSSVRFGAKAVKEAADNIVSQTKA